MTFRDKVSKVKGDISRRYDGTLLRGDDYFGNKLESLGGGGPRGSYGSGPRQGRRFRRPCASRFFV